jgi:nucleotide-binding universal stress UspA family protein
MKLLSRILAATDLSAPARHAVERAFHLAASANCELYILNAIELDSLDSLRELLGGRCVSGEGGFEHAMPMTA